MATQNSPELFPVDHSVNSRAPPPSPVNSGRRSSFANEDFLADFLDHSLRVPRLILPDAIFPKQRRIDGPLAIVLDHPGAADIISEAAAAIGCFQVVDHGISSELVGKVREAAAAGIFATAAEERAAVTRSVEMPYGFEEAVVGEGENGHFSEEFMWSVDEGLDSIMEAIWPLGYSNFRKQMETLMSKIEKIGDKLTSIMTKNNNKSVWQIHNQMGTKCCLYKNDNKGRVWNSESIRHDVIRMLMRRNDNSHMLCLHFCGDSSEFHIYSKKEWLSFCPIKDALVVTIGDQIQTWSGGKYKHVIGRSMLKEAKDGCECISMAFLYSPLTITNNNDSNSISIPVIIKSENIISLKQQLFLAIVLTLVYQFLACIYHKF